MKNDNLFSALCWASDKMNVPVQATLQAHMILKYGTPADEADVATGATPLAAKYQEILRRIAL